MALFERNYMREEFNAPRTAVTLIWILLGVFLVQSILIFYWDINLVHTLGLSLAGLAKGRVWQLVTFQFLHSAPWPFHVLFNCLGLWFFGRPVEEHIGTKKFLKLYFLSGFVGGVLQMLLTLLLPRHADYPVIGASAGVCGLVAVFCSLFPMQELTTWIYFFPIRIRARFLLIFLTGISVFGAIIPFDGLAHAAHLGGILAGLGFVRYGGLVASWFEGFLPRNPGPITRRSQPRKLGSGKRRSWLPWKNRDVTFISKNIDPILDKISAQGFESLTEQERKLLDEARKKL